MANAIKCVFKYTYTHMYTCVCMYIYIYMHLITVEFKELCRSFSCRRDPSTIPKHESLGNPQQPYWRRQGSPNTAADSREEDHKCSDTQTRKVGNGAVERSGIDA